MVTIHINASKEYDVMVGSGLLCSLGQEAASVTTGRTAVIISDSNVWSVYGKTASDSLEKAGFSVHSWIFHPGETGKSSENYLNLLSFLVQKQITRSDCLIALGGGVAGDLTGFAAGTYLRGIAYIQVPTSLLAMVDSSVGGKTAINLPTGKNLVGVFHQPRLVLCDTNTLTTLSNREFISGCAEIIKYGVLYDEALFTHIEKSLLDFDRCTVISRCIELKRDAVAADEFDVGIRQMLNLGHTLGHSIEKLTNYQLTHGEAVSIGMSMICRSAAAHGQLGAEDRDRIIALLEHFGLPTATDLPINAIIHQAMNDKKRQGERITLVIPATIGCGKLEEMPILQLKDYVKEGN